MNLAPNDAPNETTPASTPPSKSGTAWLIPLLVGLTAVSLVVAIVVALVLRRYAYETMRVPQGAMAPSIFAGETVLLDKVRYRSSSSPVAPNDVVVYALASRGETLFVGRVVAVASQRVQFDAATGALSIDGALQQRCELGPWPREGVAAIEGPARTVFYERLGTWGHLLLQRSDRASVLREGAAPTRCVAAPCTVPEGHVLVVGDDRDDAYDGRHAGFVAVEQLRGRVSRVLQSAQGGRIGAELTGAPWVPAALHDAYQRCF